ncbi:MAG: tRNA (5-methylaminomethyl-2-thiouridine)(34)-methyltransferase MnmD [Bacteroidaceae bacterium]|nr:tRNA (5-methylaminomethyl-2-thiouridine)(34)-methyltransferase MnmD [Bacteroidaceae bacterium]
MEKITDIVAETTADGSTTLYIKRLDEHYHSVKGALTESQHIYRDCAFKYRAIGEPIRLLEIGFGTGLNAAVTAMAAGEGNPVHYISLEKYPLDMQLVETLGYQDIVDADILEAIHNAPWNVPTVITPYFTLEKREADYLADELPTDIDVVYFDAFAPEKQPEMWSREAFERLCRVLNDGAVLTTYCAKGNIRRLFAQLGLVVERLPGPVGGKREILRASKPIEAL